jgi:short subunit dehydrogenase-like uncharacterized protein
VPAVAADRDFDVVLFGATGFVGRLVAAYLAEHAPAQTLIALAGRSPDRLAAVRAELGPTAAQWPQLVVDSSDQASLAAMARASRVVVSTVGPYARHGLPLVGACAAAGTHYADLTGEVLFVRDSIDSAHERATATGSRIVHACGFDSIPSDLGVLVLHDAARTAGAGDLENTTLVVTGMRGGFSGGTIASALGQIDETAKDPQRRRITEDPYALSPDRSQEPAPDSEPDFVGIEYDAELGRWLAPFVMAPFNTRIVRRSNALADWSYGRRFRYRETTGAGAGLLSAGRAAAISGASWAGQSALAFQPARAVLAKVLPSAGSGPSERARRTGYFRLQIHTRTSAGGRYLARVAAVGDPGYAATSMMLGESALCLALDSDRLPARAGVLTPATAMGMPLVERLRAAGMTLQAQGADQPGKGSDRD